MGEGRKLDEPWQASDVCSCTMYWHCVGSENTRALAAVSWTVLAVALQMKVNVEVVPAGHEPWYESDVQPSPPTAVCRVYA